jgi:hypothetical protein
MFSRVRLYQITLLLGLMACGGDDSASSENNASVAGANAGSSGASGASARASAGSRSRTTAGRGAIAGGQMCPMTEAEASGTCTPARGSCTFGTRTCDCIAGSNSWACWSASDCPASVPAERSSCAVVGMTCSPGGSNCSCTSAGWDCGRQYCPPAEPASGGMCDSGTGSCMYGTRVCDCTNSSWACWDPATACPNPPPPDRSTCPMSGIVCEYPGGTCQCNAMSGWRCGRGVMNDEDAGVPPATGSGGAVARPTAGTSAAGTTAAGVPAAGMSAGAPSAGTGAGMSAAGASAP